MPYYKFKNSDVYRNTLKTYPSIKFTVYDGSAFYNNAPNISGAFADPIRLTDAGHISLYEMNVDRVSSTTGRFFGTAPTGPTALPDKGLIYSFVVKNGSRMGFRTQASEEDWDASEYGQVLFGNYPYTSSINKEYYGESTARQAPGYPPSQGSAYVSHISALKNTINYYRYMNPRFQYSSSVRNFSAVTPQEGATDIGLVSIPAIFYGSQIKKGTINLRYYITGTLVGQARDENRDGSIWSVFGEDSGSVIGLALYNEGFLILTGTTDLSSTITDTYLPANDYPKWVYFAQSISGSITAPDSLFIMEMSGTSTTQTLTMFASARKGQLNQSSNPTFLEYSANNYAATGSKTYIENDKMQIKNVVSSSYPDPTGSFEKTTYISKVGVYDESKNLILIAKVATPVKKTVERDFTFKIKLDI